MVIVAVLFVALVAAFVVWPIWFTWTGRSVERWDQRDGDVRCPLMPWTWRAK